MTILLQASASPPPPGVIVARAAPAVQMIATTLRPVNAHMAIERLGPDDAAEMRALAKLTEPGPFEARTHELGDFFGVRDQGRLVAMAGERMKPDGFTEVSGVCTHPDYRGRGYAGRLMSAVMAQIRDRGETPFLHAYATNTGAISLYRTLGFVLRCEMIVTMLARPQEPSHT